MEKKGLSPVIASMMLVLLAIVVVGIVWVVVVNVVEENTAEIENIDEFNIRLEVTKAENETNGMDVTIRRKIGGGEITGIYLTFSNGDEAKAIKNETLILSQGETKTTHVTDTQLGTQAFRHSVTEVSVAALIGDNKRISKIVHTKKLSR